MAIDSRRVPAVTPWLAGGLASLASWALYGSAVLSPAHIAWLMHGDPAQHLNGLAFFLAEPWQWPPGAIQGMGGMTSVVFTDSIPWLALLLKVLHWPVNWQPFGWWMLFCHAAACFLTVRLLQCLGMGALGAVCTALMLAFAPMVLMRTYGHESLMAHFLLPGALLLALRPWSAWRWALWLVLALGIHAYWLVMVGIWALAAAWHAWKTNARPLKWLVLDGLGMVIALVSAAGLLGYGVGDGQHSAAGFGHYSANLLTWFDPMDWADFLSSHGRDPSQGRPWSLWWPAIGQVTSGQYEGFAWLGLGLCVVVLGVSAVALARYILALSRPAFPEQPMPWGPLWGAACLLAVVAWSHVWGVGRWQWVAWPLPETVLNAIGVFRSSGRFIWPLTWLMVLVVCLRVAQWRYGRWVLVCALGLQAADLSGKFHELSGRFRGAVPIPDQVVPVQSPAWPRLLGRCRSVLFLTPNIQASAQWAPVAWVVAQQGGAIYPAPTARLNPQRQQEQQALLTSLQAGRGWNESTLYVTWPGAIEPQVAGRIFEQARRVQPQGMYMQLDGYTVWAPPRCQ